MVRRHAERHLIERIGWLRAGILGANDGIISTASLMVGVASATTSAGQILLTGIAGLVAGSMSMAAGEYVSVSSQADTERADLAREQAELAAAPEEETDELAEIYIGRGVEATLARQVATQLMAKDALGAHAKDELGISEAVSANPIQAGVTSALTFAAGASAPLIVAVLAPASIVPFAIAGCFVGLSRRPRRHRCEGRGCTGREGYASRGLLGRFGHGGHSWDRKTDRACRLIGVVQSRMQHSHKPKKAKYEVRQYDDHFPLGDRTIGRGALDGRPDGRLPAGAFAYSDYRLVEPCDLRICAGCPIRLADPLAFDVGARSAGSRSRRSQIGRQGHALHLVRASLRNAHAWNSECFHTWLQHVRALPSSAARRQRLEEAGYELAWSCRRRRAHRGFRPCCSCVGSPICLEGWPAGPHVLQAWLGATKIGHDDAYDVFDRQGLLSTASSVRHQSGYVPVCIKASRLKSLIEKELQNFVCFLRVLSRSAAVL